MVIIAPVVVNELDDKPWKFGIALLQVRSAVPGWELVAVGL